jgi:hypothetical protein
MNEYCEGRIFWDDAACPDALFIMFIFGNPGMPMNWVEERAFGWRKW